MPAIKLLIDIILWSMGILGILMFTIGQINIGEKDGPHFFYTGFIRALFSRSITNVLDIQTKKQAEKRRKKAWVEKHSHLTHPTKKK